MTVYALPPAYLPRYQCPHCEIPLRYDATTNPETQETGAQCDACGRAWIVTAQAASGSIEAGVRARFDFTMREVNTRG